MIEFLFQLLAEAFVQLVIEVLVELGLHSTGHASRKPINPWLAALGYAVFGALAGGLSLLVLPAHLLQGHGWRVLALVFVPLVAGLTMTAIGAWRSSHGQPTLRIDRFSYGYLFALSMALVRFLYAA